MKKPAWLNKKIDISACRKVKSLLRDLKIDTVCEQALCPNISECFNCGVATFMILGNVCTRGCEFCGVKKGKPQSVDYNEPERIKEAVKLMGLNYVVITSPTRDDLNDGGASIFCKIVESLLCLNPDIKVEILIPDFLGNLNSLGKIASSKAAIIAHNIETVPSLYDKVRLGADYERSLFVLRVIKEKNREVFTKSGLMLGLGESDSEVLKVMEDLRSCGCEFLTLGQYLPPSLKHYLLKEYVLPERFQYLKSQALRMGFSAVKSSPYVRSSYMTHTFI